MKCLACAGRNYGVPKGWIAALGVRATGPVLKRKVRAIHSVSSYVQTIMRRDFLDDRLAMQPEGHVIHDVIGGVRIEQRDSQNRAATLARLNDLPTEPFLMFVGGLRRVKGVEELIAAYRQLTDPPPLVLIGTLERDSPRHFPPDVYLLKDFPHDAVMKAWDRCLFGVLPSVLPEPFGTVVCEAMSRGKAVIGTKPGGHTDMIIDGVTGLLVPGGDVPALAAAMRRLIDDGELRDRLGAAARERANLYTVEYAIPRLEQLYKDLLEARIRAA